MYGVKISRNNVTRNLWINNGIHCGAESHNKAAHWGRSPLFSFISITPVILIHFYTNLDYKINIIKGENIMIGQIERDDGTTNIFPFIIQRIQLI